MIDPFVLLAPLLLLAVVGLLQFVGCDAVFGLVQVPPQTMTTPITILYPLAETDTTSNDDGGQVSATFASPGVVAENLILVWIWYKSPPAPDLHQVATVTDSVGNVYQRAIGPTDGTTGLAGYRQELWYKAMANGGGTVQVTATFDGTFIGEKAISAHQYQGAQDLDVTRTASASGDTGSASVGPVTGNVTELVFAAGLFPGTGEAGIGDGFIQRSHLAGNITEDKQIPISGPIFATFTNDVTTAWLAQMVILLPKTVPAT